MTLTIDVWSTLRFLGWAVGAAAAVFIVVTLVSRVRDFFASRKFEVGDREAMKRRWQEIESLALASGEVSRKLAVVEADKLLDSALKTLAMPGMTLGERLKFAAYKYPQLKEVWWAHRVRNQLVHEASFHLERKMAIMAIKTYKIALKRLGAI
jgi:hypothetical protein